MNNSIDELPDFLTFKEVAEIFRCSKRSISERARQGLIPTVPGFDKPKLVPKKYVLDVANNYEVKVCESDRSLTTEIDKKRISNRPKGVRVCL